MTKIYKINPLNIDMKLLREAAVMIKEGKLVAFPTETVYGIGCNTYNIDSINRIFEVKGRPKSDPIIVHISEPGQLTEIAIDIPELAYELATRYWPGPLTLILKRNENIPSEISAGMPTVAVRLPSHRVAKKLIELSTLPVAAPSANTFTRPSATTVEHVLEDLNGKVDLIIDGGNSSIGIESTVLDLSGRQPKILRPGGINIEELNKKISNLEFKPQYLEIMKDMENPSSPGMLLKHYSPRAQLVLFKGEGDATLKKMLNYAREARSKGKKPTVLTVKEDDNIFRKTGIETYCTGEKKDLATVAYNLFTGMRVLDSMEADIILVRNYSMQGIGLAIWDRLYRAAAGNIVE